MAEDILNAEQGSGYELENYQLDTDKILFSEDDGYFTFTSETQLEGRKIGYEVGKSELKQRLGQRYKDGFEDSYLRGLKAMDKILDDYRLDGNQLSFSEEYNPKDKTWKTLIFFRYGGEVPENQERLSKAMNQLGFTKDN